MFIATDCYSIANNITFSPFSAFELWNNDLHNSLPYNPEITVLQTDRRTEPGPNKTKF